MDFLVVFIMKRPNLLRYAFLYNEEWFLVIFYSRVCLIFLNKIKKTKHLICLFFLLFKLIKLYTLMTSVNKFVSVVFYLENKKYSYM